MSEKIRGQDLKAENDEAESVNNMAQVAMRAAPAMSLPLLNARVCTRKHLLLGDGKPKKWSQVEPRFNEVLEETVAFYYAGMTEVLAFAGTRFEFPTARERLVLHDEPIVKPLAWVTPALEWARRPVSAWRSRQRALQKNGDEYEGLLALPALDGSGGVAVWMLGEVYSHQGFFYKAALRTAGPIAADGDQLSGLVVEMARPRELVGTLQIFADYYEMAREKGSLAFHSMGLDLEPMAQTSTFTGVICWGAAGKEALEIAWKAPPKKRTKKTLALEDAEGLVPLGDLVEDGMTTTAEEETTESCGAPGSFDDPAGQEMMEALEQREGNELLNSKESRKLQEKAATLCATVEDEADLARNLAHLHNLSRGMDPKGRLVGAAGDSESEPGDSEDEDDEQSAGQAGGRAPESITHITDKLWTAWAAAALAGDEVLTWRLDAARVEAEDLRGVLTGRRNPAFSLVEFPYDETLHGVSDHGGKERVVVVEFVEWELLHIRGQALAVVDDEVAVPVFNWQKVGLFAPGRKFNPGEAKDVLPNTGLRFATRTGKKSNADEERRSNVTIPAKLMQLRKMWSVALHAGELAGLRNADCQVCQHQEAGAPPGGEPVAQCPLCLLCWHEGCARAVATAAATVSMAVPSLRASLPERFSRDALCALCRAARPTTTTTTTTTAKRKGP